MRLYAGIYNITMPVCASKITWIRRNICCDFWTKNCDSQTFHRRKNVINGQNNSHKTLLINTKQKKLHTSSRTMFIYKENSFSKERRTKKKGEKTQFSIICPKKSLIFRDSSNISHITKRRVYIKNHLGIHCTFKI